jgi:glycerol uptake facilitator-like aquaporin
VVLTISHSNIGVAYFVAFAAGLAVLVGSVGMSRMLQLNPAYTLALWTGRQLRTVKSAVYIIAQLVGGYAAYWLYRWFVGAGFRHAPHHFDSHVLVAEAIGTFVFVFIAAGAMYQKQHWAVRSGSMGSAYTLGIFVASVGSLGYINPAVALGSNAWVWGTYVLGPVLGAIIGVNLYGLLFAPASSLVSSDTGHEGKGKTGRPHKKAKAASAK